MAQIKKAYTTPEVSDFGKVTDLTSAVGMTFITDSTLNGSMEFPGMGVGGGAGGGMGM